MCGSILMREKQDLLGINPHVANNGSRARDTNICLLHLFINFEQKYKIIHSKLLNNQLLMWGPQSELQGPETKSRPSAPG